MAIRFFLLADPSFQLDSEDYVNSMIAASIADMDMSGVKFGMPVLSYEDVKFNNHGFGKESADKCEVLYLVRHSRELDSSQLKVAGTRKQQLGIQGWGVYFLSRVHQIVRLDPKYFYHGLRMLNTLLLALILVGISFQLRKAYDALFALCFYCMCSLSVWLTNFAPNLYWVPFTWFMPMLFGLMCMNYPEHRRWIYPLVFLSIVLKCLCGYEYITNVMMCAVVFSAAEYFACTSDDLPRKKLMFRITLGVGLSALAGFITAITFHAYIRGDGSILQGLNEIYHADVLRRTFGSPEDFPSVYTDSLNASILKVLAKYLFSRSSMWLALVLCVLVSASSYSAKAKHHIRIRHDVSLFVMSFLSSISWFVLAKSHSYIHVHMNFVLWQMPFIPAASYIFLRQRISVIAPGLEKHYDEALRFIGRIFFMRSA